MDLIYIENYSIWQDLKLIFQTFTAVSYTHLDVYKRQPHRLDPSFPVSSFIDSRRPPAPVSYTHLSMGITESWPSWGTMCPTSPRNTRRGLTWRT